MTIIGRISVPMGYHHVCAHTRSQQLAHQHQKANAPYYFAADDKQCKPANVSGEVKHLGMRGGFGKVKTA